VTQNKVVTHWMEHDDQDIVLGEGRWIGFLAPEQALDRDLSASAALMVPMFLSSDTYADLRSQVLS
jgi:hypothetical protein